MRPRRRSVSIRRGPRMRDSTGSGRQRRMTARTEPDRVEPETGPLGRTWQSPARARDPGHMTSRAARLRMRSPHTTSAPSRRRPTACLYIAAVSSVII